MSTTAQDDPIEREIQRRLDQLSDNDWALRRYDRNGDGKLDEHEWAVVVSLVRRQVQKDFSELKRESGQEPSTPAASVVVDFDNLDEPDEWGVDTDPHIDLTARETLGERYDVLHELGSGTQADTFLGRDRQTSTFVAIKELAIDRLDDWKSFELFERESRVLRQLDHPAIPRFIDSLEVERDGDHRLFLVQEYVDGDTLASEIERRGTFESADVFNLARQLLEVLAYLQSLSPPIIHRDIKPSNIIRRRDGRIMLVDFGGVQSKMSTNMVGGSTVVGTSGYMPPEQLMGRANVTTDLYGLGATLVHLATGHHPSMIPEERARLKWRQYAAIDGALADFIDALIEPIWEDRPAGAAQALESLEQAVSGPPTGSHRAVSGGAGTGAMTSITTTTTAMSRIGSADQLVIRRPDDCFVSIERDPRFLTIRIPPRFVRFDWNLVFVGSLTIAAAFTFFAFTGLSWLLVVGSFGVLVMILGIAFAHRAAVITANQSGWSRRVIRGGWWVDEDWFDAPITAARFPEPGDAFSGRYDLVIEDAEGRPVDTGLRSDEVAWIVYEIGRWVHESKGGPDGARGPDDDSSVGHR